MFALFVAFAWDRQRIATWAPNDCLQKLVERKRNVGGHCDADNITIFVPRQLRAHIYLK